MSSPTHYIDGRFVASNSDRRIEVIDPATQERLGQVGDGNASDVAAAVAAARRTFESAPWSGMTGQERGRMLFRRGRRASMRALLCRSIS